MGIIIPEDDVVDLTVPNTAIFCVKEPDIIIALGTADLISKSRF